ncbi:hypothetical protein HII31_08212, partial [Pseudocercospora fuligena]
EYNCSRQEQPGCTANRPASPNSLTSSALTTLTNVTSTALAAAIIADGHEAHQKERPGRTSTRARQRFAGREHTTFQPPCRGEHTDPSSRTSDLSPSHQHQRWLFSKKASLLSVQDWLTTSTMEASQPPKQGCLRRGPCTEGHSSRPRLLRNMVRSLQGHCAKGSCHTRKDANRGSEAGLTEPFNR